MDDKNNAKLECLQKIIKKKREIEADRKKDHWETKKLKTGDYEGKK